MSAANPRTGRTTPKKPGRPAYEELQPRFEWEDDASSLVLNVFLPGFVKEQLKLTYDEPTRSLNVRGERPIGPGRFVRFNKDFRISPPPLPPLPPQAPKPGQITYRRTALPKEDDILNNKAQEGDGSGKLPPTSKKVDDRIENERPSTIIPPTPLVPLPNPSPKPIPNPAPWTKVLKENSGMKDRPKEWETSRYWAYDTP